MPVGPHGGVSVRIATTPQGQGHRTVAAQVAADALGVAPEDVEVRDRHGHGGEPWTVASGDYSSRFSGVGRRGRAPPRASSRARLRAIAAPILECAPEDVELAGGKARVVGDARARGLAAPARRRRALEPRGAPGRASSPACTATAYFAAPNLDPPDADDRVDSSGIYGFIVDVAVVEIERGDRRGRACSTTRPSTTRAGILNPLLAEGQMRGGLRARRSARLCSSEHRYDEDGNLLTATLHGLPAARRRRSSRRSDRRTARRRRRSRRSARRGSARATR